MISKSDFTSNKIIPHTASKDRFSLHDAYTHWFHAVSKLSVQTFVSEHTGEELKTAILKMVEIALLKKLTMKNGILKNNHY